VQNGQPTELQVFLDKLTDAHLVCQVLKAVNQAALGAAATEYLIMTHAGFGLPMKDLQGGWKIFIDISAHSVQVTHKRHHIILPQDKTLPVWPIPLQLAGGNLLSRLTLVDPCIAMTLAF